MASSMPVGRRPPDGSPYDPWGRGQGVPHGPGAMLRWTWERLWGERAPDPAPEELPRAEPELAVSGLAADADELWVTWAGQATFLLQLPGITLLTDPVFSDRASPFRWAGPRRFSPPGLALDALPPVDGVLLSHDHYDHLDAPTVDALNDRFGAALTWYTPRGYAPWFDRRGVERVVELDWWEKRRVWTGDGDWPGGGHGRRADGGSGVELRALPARHWTRRRLFDAGKRLWCSWSIEVAGRRIYFGGDSGYTPAFTEIGERAGPFDLALLPIGAYEPRWFMRTSHMNPEEAVQAARDVRASAMVGMHWGTFRLTDEPPLEPPHRTRRAWSALGLSPSDLYIPALGETLRF